MRRAGFLNKQERVQKGAEWKTKFSCDDRIPVFGPIAQLGEADQKNAQRFSAERLEQERKAGFRTKQESVVTKRVARECGVL
jgi:hypothetical protein